jgi:hypothetical protein
MAAERVAGWIKETKLGIESSLIPLWCRWAKWIPFTCPLIPCFASLFPLTHHALQQKTYPGNSVIDTQAGLLPNG